jgi:hypothetical protein
MMEVVPRVGLDIIKLNELKKKMGAIAFTVDANMPQTNKNRRIKSLVGIAERLITEMIVVKYEEVQNG